MCDCGSDCFCTWVNKDEKKVIEEWLKKNGKDLTPEEVQAKKRKMMYNIAILRQINTDAMFGSIPIDMDSIIKSYLKYYDNPTEASRKDNDAVLAMLLVGMGRLKNAGAAWEAGIDAYANNQGNQQVSAIYAAGSLFMAGKLLPIIGNALDGMGKKQELELLLNKNHYRSALYNFATQKYPADMPLNEYPVFKNDGFDDGDGPGPCHCKVPETSLWDTLGLREAYAMTPQEYLKFMQGQGVQPPSDPLVFDLDGDGFETVSDMAGVTFDHDGDGFKTGTGWVSGDDGFLASYTTHRTCCLAVAP